MATPSPTAERREAMLGELAEWLHAAAQKVQRKLMDAEETDEVVRLAGSLTKLARGVRQCVLMHDRLESVRLKDEAGVAAEQAQAEKVARGLAVYRLKSRVGRAISRRFEEEWLEGEDADDEDAFEDRSDRLNVLVTERLDDLSETEAFLSQDPDALIAQLCEEFGVTPPPPQILPRNAGEGDHETGLEGALRPQGRGLALNGHAAPNSS